MDRTLRQSGLVTDTMDGQIGLLVITVLLCEKHENTEVPVNAIRGGEREFNPSVLGRLVIFPRKVPKPWIGYFR
ncbi:hypothetical protein [Paeniglutamicibacter sp.]|uniref:hypothetical protein n=1 Tax=Paeniglutamicibacter sp. TaxID=1934391 RepID=UPI003989EECE